MTGRSRFASRRGGFLVAASALALVSVAPSAVATDPTVPAPGDGVAVTPPATEPSTTIGAPVPTSSTLPGSPDDPTSSTTSSTTSTSVPGTTLPPVGDDEIDQGSGGYAAVPAPLIPSADDDPLFHAALTVDDDLVNLSKAQVTYLRKIAATRAVAVRAMGVRGDYDEVRASDRDAREHLAATRSILRAAALHAYTGFGSADAATNTPEVDEDATAVPYRTYVRVTIADASRHVNEAVAAQSRTGLIAATARGRDRAAQGALDTARADERAAKQAVADAKEKLERDRENLRRQLAAMPDMAPGAFDRLPDSAELPPGAHAVESPVGTIVVPATADPRTVVALQFIIAQIGKPYVWGGTGPSSYDCSGLMLRGFQAAGVRTMPRVSQAQQVWATPIDPKDAQPGDLVFFGNPAYHVGVYIGGGLMIDAPFTGARVRVDRVWSSVTGYGRVIW